MASRLNLAAGHILFAGTYLESSRAPINVFKFHDVRFSKTCTHNNTIYSTRIYIIRAVSRDSRHFESPSTTTSAYIFSRPRLLDIIILYIYT